MPEQVLGTTLAIPTTILGANLGGSIARNKTTEKIKKEVFNRLDEIKDRAVKGDKKAEDFLLHKLKNPKVFNKLIDLTYDNPRLNKAVKKGMIIGASIPLAINGSLVASGIYNNKKHNIAKEQYLKDLKAWKERNNKK